MLVLSRRLGEAIRIADRITITVLELRGSRVKLGIEAPAGIAILRDELVELCGGSTALRLLRQQHSPEPQAHPCSK